MSKNRTKVKVQADPRQSPTTAAKAPASPASTEPAGKPLESHSTHTSAEGKLADDAKLPKRKNAELVSVSVHTPFNLTRDDDSRVRYETGVQDIPRDDAEHWYAQHHLEKNED